MRLSGPLARRDFRLLLAARTISTIGQGVALVALPFAVLDVGGTPTDVGLVGAARWIPQILFMLLGGVIADRLPRQRVLVVSDTVAMAAQGACAVLLLTGGASVALLAALQAVGGAALALFFPAANALVPQTVPALDRPRANALLSFSTNSAAAGGAALGGGLAAVSTGTALGVDAVSFGVSAALCTGILARAVSGQVASTVWAELREGFAEFTRRRWVWAVVLQFGLVNLCFEAVLFVLGPVQAERHLGGAGAWGAVVAAFSAGLVGGALVSLRLHPQRPLLFATLAVLPSAALPALLVAPAPIVPIAMVAALGGVGFELFGIQWSLALQDHVPEQAMARVSSYDALGSFALIPLGFVLAGPLADLLGIAAVLVAASVMMSLATLGALAVADVRGLRAVKR